MSALAEAEQKTVRRHRSPHGVGLYVTDAELIEYLGVPYKTACVAIAALDRDRSQNFPQKQKLWGDRRYLPAVQAWLDRKNGLTVASSRRDHQ
jgi:hypothetical protein